MGEAFSLPDLIYKTWTTQKSYPRPRKPQDIDLYKEQVHLKHFPHSKGHLQTRKDMATRQIILDMMCRHYTAWPSDNMDPMVLFHLKDLEEDGLVQLEKDGIRITVTGQAFVRNICAVFDRRMRQQKSTTFVFSKAI